MSKVEDDLEQQFLASDLPGFVREYKAIKGRRFKWDFAFLEQRLLIEVQGGVFMRRGGHTSGVGVTRDCEKHNLAYLAGWGDLLVTTQMVKDGRALEWTKIACGKLETSLKEGNVAKEIGIPKNAPKRAKQMDERADRKAGIKEGSKQDLAKDRAIMKKFGKKGGR